MGQRTFWTTALTGLISSATVHAAPPASLPADQLDWQRWGDDKPSNALCTGHYVIPGYQIDVAPNPTQIRSESSGAGYGDNGETILQGEVVLRKEDQQLEAPEIIINRERTNAHVNGPLAYRRNGMLVRGDSADVALNSDAAQIDNAHYVFHDAQARGDATQLARLEDGRYQLTEATFTTCEPQSSLWKMVGSNVIIDRAAGYGTAHHARLEVEDIPVFYWPWIRFPIDDRRHTGLLWPTLGYGNDNGFDYSQPIYLNLAPNYDATITPRYIQRRGEMLGGEFRYLFGEEAGTVEGAYMAHDSGDEDDDHEGEKRWYFNYTHNGRFSPRTVYNLRYGAASDGDYFDDFGRDFAEQDTDNLQRLARIDYAGDVWHLQARARGFQKMDDPLSDNDKPFYELPSLTANGRWHQQSGFYEEWNSNATYFWRDVDAEKVRPYESATGSRVHLAPALGWRQAPSWGFFEPRVEMLYTQYDLDWHNRTGTEGRDETPDRTLPVYSVDSGLVFERQTELFGRNWRQTLEPRLYYAYVPYRDQSEYPEFDTDELPISYGQLWSPYRFTGVDRIGDVNKLSYGVSTRFLEDASGRERLALSVGQSRYFENRHVVDDADYAASQQEGSEQWYQNHRDRSPVIGQADWQVSDRWQASQAIFYDTHRDMTEKSATYLRYRHPEGHVLNLGYRYEVEGFDPSGDAEDRLGYNRDEYDVSFAWKATPAVSVVGRYLYDHTNSRSLETLAGLQFNDCCYGVEVAWREWVDDEDTANDIDDDETKRGLFLRFIFKGLGGIGQQADPYLTEAIPGYDPQQF
ncbi:LPS-assembly protein LptD [Phytohalomonas tamaricis]|uniref:LPS-assembly protein LptD n=1 Tax=Phytohalomonas tamaricis TaxID=2081032 RepID=UPI000D0B99BB|nr:LPS-assembly protein LptD [Phytohalomonas tamaricis]